MHWLATLPLIVGANSIASSMCSANCSNTPKIVAPASILVSGLLVSIEAVGGKEVRYTTDGSDPTYDSALYKGQIWVTASMTLKAASFDRNNRVGEVAAQTFTKVVPTRGSHMSMLSSGLDCEEFHGLWRTVPNFDSMQPDISFVTSAFGPPQKNGVVEKQVGQLYEGFVNVKTEDVYLFSLTSRDGAKLWIDGRLTIDDDGLHRRKTKKGAEALGVGAHRIKLAWFHADGPAALSLEWAPVDGKMAPFGIRDISHMRRMPKGAP